ncbi:MAG TPA: Rieske 2Fe-2S domain-containing protein [Anaerolineales bacterium]|nr:Rieske 2Fe-2S domain-containing protein [Anaerolineales bacterium]
MTVAGAIAPTTPPMTRREFLYYIWGASMALFMAELGGATVWFALPRFKEGEFGGRFTYDVAEVPAVDAPPKDFPDGRFWLSNIGPGRIADPEQPGEFPAQEGVIAIYKVCVHLGCLYKWVPENDRFECPCHGSKYLATGTRIEGPATRNLDAFILEALDASENVLAKTDANSGAPFKLPDGTAKIRIDTGKRLQGSPNSV